MVITSVSEGLKVSSSSLAKNKVIILQICPQLKICYCLSTVHTFRFLQISIIIITIIFTITIIIVIIYILIFFLLCSDTWRTAILIILQWTNSTTFEENNTFSDTISKWSLSSLSILEQWRYTRIIKVVLASVSARWSFLWKFGAGYLHKD